MPVTAVIHRNPESVTIIPGPDTDPADEVVECDSPATAAGQLLAKLTLDELIAFDQDEMPNLLAEERAAYRGLLKAAQALDGQAPAELPTRPVFARAE